MSQMEIDRVLSQIRAIRSSATGGIAEAAQASQAVGGADSKSSVSFAAVLKGGLDKVNDAQQRARVAATDFESGKPGMDHLIAACGPAAFKVLEARCQRHGSLSASANGRR